MPGSDRPRISRLILAMAGALVVAQLVQDVVVPGWRGIAQAALRPDDFWAFSSGHCRRALFGELMYLADRAGVPGGFFAGLLLAAVAGGVFVWAVPRVLRDESPGLALLLCLTPLIPIWPADREMLLVLPALVLYAVGRVGVVFILTLAACMFIHEAVALFYAPACLALVRSPGRPGRVRGALLVAVPAVAFACLVLWRPEATNALERLYWPSRGMPDVSVDGGKLYSFASMGPVDVARFHASLARSSVREFVAEIGSLLAFGAAVVWALNRRRPRPLETCYQFMALGTFFVATIDYGRYYAPLFAVFLLMGDGGLDDGARKVGAESAPGSGIAGWISARGRDLAGRMVQARTWLVAGLVLLPIDWWAGGTAQFPAWMHRARTMAVLSGSLLRGQSLSGSASPEPIMRSEAHVGGKSSEASLAAAEPLTGLAARRSLAAGVDGWMAITSSGHLAVESVPGRTWPAAVPPGSLPALMAVSAGSEHAVALDAIGRMHAWGGNAFGQCDVPTAGSAGTRVAAGYAHSVVALRDGRVICWGSNVLGQCDVPGELGPVSDVSAGSYHTMALEATGRVRCWGGNVVRQCDVPAGLGPAIGIGAGWMHSLAVDAHGRVHAWGSRRAGQTAVPPMVEAAIAVAGGAHHSMALTADGIVRCWGGDQFGQCLVPDDLGNVSEIAAGAFHSCALRSDGTVVSWGAPMKRAEASVNGP